MEEGNLVSPHKDADLEQQKRCNGILNCTSSLIPPEKASSRVGAINEEGWRDGKCVNTKKL